ncbi:MAG: hypothetical protein ACPGR8_01145 [Limisphaerales bacterium]
MGVGELVEEVILLPPRVVRNGIIIAPFLAAGLALVSLRWLFMEFCPWGARHSSLVATFVNLLMDVCWAIFEAIKIAIQVIVKIVNTFKHKKSHGVTIDDPPDQVSSHDIEHFLNTIPVMCHDYVWANNELLVFPLKWLLSPSVCPLLRYLWPVGWAFTASDALLGWVSVDPTPIAGGGNCEMPPDSHWICVGFGSGYLVLEIFVPLMVLLLIALPLIIVLVKEAFSLLRESVKLTLDVEGFVMRIVNRLGVLVEDFISVN